MNDKKLEKDGNDETLEKYGNEEIIELRRSKRRRIKKYFGRDMLTYMLEEDPKTFQEAMSLPDSIMWKKVTYDEIKSILDNQTWTLVELPRVLNQLIANWF